MHRLTLIYFYNNDVNNQCDMQINENYSTNTKTFPEIWAGLSEEEKDALCLKLYQRKCVRSRQGVWYWANGKRRPATPLVRDIVAEIVSKVVGEKCYARYLFPSS